jgi:hypothetical protein
MYSNKKEVYTKLLLNEVLKNDHDVPNQNPNLNPNLNPK